MPILKIQELDISRSAIDRRLCELTILYAINRRNLNPCFKMKTEGIHLLMIWIFVYLIVSAVGIIGKHSLKKKIK